MSPSAAELKKGHCVRIFGISSMISSSRAHRVLLVSPEYIIDDNEPTECVSAEKAAAGRKPSSQLDRLVFLYSLVSPLLSDKHAHSESLEGSHLTGRA